MIRPATRPPTAPCSRGRALGLVALLAVGCTGPTTPTPAVATRADAPISVTSPATLTATPPTIQPPATPAPPTPIVVPTIAEPTIAEPTTPVPPGPAHVAEAPVPSLDAGPLPPDLFRPQPSADGTAMPSFLTPLPAIDADKVERATPGWERVLSFDRSVQVERFVAGMLVLVGGVPHEPGPDGALVARPEVDHRKVRLFTDSGAPLGTWPGDAWRRGDDWGDGRGDSEVLYFRLTASGRWVAQRLIDSNKAYENMFEGLQWSPRGGLLLMPTRWSQDDELPDTFTFRRVGSTAPVPKPLVTAPGVTGIGVVETHDGTIYLITQPMEPEIFGIDIILHCDQKAVPGCERQGGVSLRSPGAQRGTYNLQYAAARQGSSFSAAVREFSRASAGSVGYLIHRERGGWTLEVLPGDLSVVHMLPVADGGLWLVLADNGEKETLWHRSPLGKWVAVPLPGGADPDDRVQIALRDPEHVWVSVDTDTQHAIFSARAALQAAPASSAK